MDLRYSIPSLKCQEVDFVLLIVKGNHGKSFIFVCEYPPNTLWSHAYIILKVGWHGPMGVHDQPFLHSPSRCLEFCYIFHILPTLFSHLSWFHDLGICQLYYAGPWKNPRILVYCSYIHAKFGDLGGVVLLALCVGIIVHPKNIRMNQCSSHDYFM